MNSIAIIEAVNTTSLPFHGQHIITAMAAGVAYVAMKPIVENIGLAWGAQQQKLMQNKDKFNYIDINMVAGDLKKRMMGCIPLKKLNGWLFSINPAKVRDDIRDRLVRYQEECFTALHDYWTKGAAIRKPETTVDDRTPLRGIVNRIMGKYGMTYQAVYKLVHKEFGVKHIDELSAKQTAEAVEYLAGKVIEGEFVGKESLPTKATKQFSDEEVVNLCYMQLWMEKAQQAGKQVYPAMKQLRSEFSGFFYDLAHETRFFTQGTKEALLREAANLDKAERSVVNAEGMFRKLRDTRGIH
ncbi:phage antirepressor N-terminal domain-containing protein [Erwinia sp. V90_4]|uniref:phage antirepressor N-terminal domain-containing protein n=1 Tax=Erwinia sp. V90_4 TaxID=3044239 RepID=UPI00249F6582|nr:phage antirepressor N-terminal domain-containing protein [Erwinia sp. V90_4]MDI3440328.1 phage antirepressor N-terminal domain-containing protein [Erwinia sp. V90_4]